MSLPIGATPVLRGKDAERFLRLMKKNENKKVGPTPTPNLWKAETLIKKLTAPKTPVDIMLERVEWKPCISKKELRSIVSEFSAGILDGNEPDGRCFMVCSALAGYLSFMFKGYAKCPIIKGSVGDCEHFWIEWYGEIIDPTANQFKRPNERSMPKVYIGKKPEWYKE